MATKQVNVRLEEEFIDEKLSVGVDRFGYRSVSDVGRDIIETYYDHWLELQIAKEEFLEQQKGRIMTSQPKRRAG